MLDPQRRPLRSALDDFPEVVDRLQAATASAAAAGTTVTKTRSSGALSGKGGNCPHWRGIWIVTTPLPASLELGVRTGDLLRVRWVLDAPKGHVWAYLVARRGSPHVPLICDDFFPVLDGLADHQGLCVAVPDAYGWTLGRPMAVPPRCELSPLDPFLSRCPQLIPEGGWYQYLRHAGITATHTPPSSWQFSAMTARSDGQGVLCCKTGGLHMSLTSDTTQRRCQLSIESGVCGDVLMGSLPGTRAGVLVYLPSMSAALAATRDGLDMCFDSALTLSFSALLVAYVEMVSLVRRAAHNNPAHPAFQQSYSARTWDFNHTPFSAAWPVGLDKRRSVCMASFVRQRANAWLATEAAIWPAFWRTPGGLPNSPRTHATVVEVEDLDQDTPGQSETVVELVKPGVRTWVYMEDVSSIR